MSYGLLRHNDLLTIQKSTAFEVASGSDSDFLVASSVEEEISPLAPHLAMQDMLSQCYVHDTNAPWHTSLVADWHGFESLREPTIEHWEGHHTSTGCFLVSGQGRSIAPTASAYGLEIDTALRQIGFVNLTQPVGHLVPKAMPGPHQKQNRWRSQVKAHFRSLRHLRANHDREGAAAPDQLSIDSALAAVDQISSPMPFYATLNDDGLAVIEFEDRATGDYGEVTFHGDEWVEVYIRLAGQPSQYTEGKLHSPLIQELLMKGLEVSC